jgi:hypothetical protein
MDQRAAWHDIYRLIQLLVDSSDGRSILKYRLVNRLWYTVIQDWHEPNVWRRILHAVVPGLAIQWSLCARYVPRFVELRPAHGFGDVFPDRNPAMRFLSVLLVDNLYRPLRWYVNVPASAMINDIVRAAATSGEEVLADASLECFAFGFRVVGEQTRLSDIRLPIKERPGLRSDVVLLFPTAVEGHASVEPVEYGAR